MNDEWPPIQPTSVHWIIRFGSKAGVLSQTATVAKIVPEFKDAFQLLCGLPYHQKAIDDAVKHYRKWMQARVSASGLFF